MQLRQALVDSAGAKPALGDQPLPIGVDVLGRDLLERRVGSELRKLVAVELAPIAEHRRRPALTVVPYVGEPALRRHAEGDPRAGDGDVRIGADQDVP
ncbi:MAG: hypothetical protein FJW90_09730 [Actinobacteria bacterium]|nr:hypothetical protein [Actinomycetota bacterium]